MGAHTNGPRDAAAHTVRQRLRAALERHGNAADDVELRMLYEQLGRPRVAAPGLPEDVRAAVVHAYAPGCGASSDPLWRAEALCTEPPPPVDSAERLGRATAALVALGAVPQPPMPCGLYHDGGGGNFDVILYDDGRGDPDRPGELFVSRLGLFVNGNDDDEDVRAALTAAGFHWIDEHAGGTAVPALDVLYFGEWTSLCVDLLLFQWQD